MITSATNSSGITKRSSTKKPANTQSLSSPPPSSMIVNQHPIQSTIIRRQSAAASIPTSSPTVVVISKSNHPTTISITDQPILARPHPVRPQDLGFYDLGKSKQPVINWFQKLYLINFNRF
jgi:hypothetical protein